MIAKAQVVCERRRGERQKLFEDVVVTDVLSQAPLGLRDVSHESVSVMSPLPFQQGTARQIRLGNGPGPAVTTTAIVTRCEIWPTKATARYIVALGFKPSDPANRAAILGFVQALMGRTAVRSH
jgi:hypothetical protein